MTLRELINLFRTLSNDKVEPYFWSDDEVILWLNEAQNEAVVRGRLLRESSDPAICRIEFVDGQLQMDLSPLLYEISSCTVHSESSWCANAAAVVTPEYLDRIRPGWRTIGKHETSHNKFGHFIVQEENFIRLIPTPDDDGHLMLEGYRLPKEPMADDDDKPEIFVHSHAKLIEWVLHKAFSIPDTEFFDPQRSAVSLSSFAQYFGLSPDSDLRRSTREDLPQVNKPFWI